MGLSSCAQQLIITVVDRAFIGLGRHLKTGQWSTGQNRPMATARTSCRSYCVTPSAGKVWWRIRQLRGPHLRTWAWWRRRSSSAVDGGGVAEELAPVVDGPVRGEQRARALVAAHDELEEVLGGGGRELAHAEVVDDEERHGGELGHLLAARAVDAGLGELFEQRRAPRGSGRGSPAGSRRGRSPARGGSCRCRAVRGRARPRAAR